MPHFGPIPAKYRICSVAQCGLKVLARGMCRRHYKLAWYRKELAPIPHEPRVQRCIVFNERLDGEISRASRITGKSHSQIIREALESFFKKSA